MKNNKILGFIVWLLGLVLSLFLLGFIPKEWTATVWVVLFFTVVVYLLHLALWILLPNIKVNFHNLPALTLSVLFLVIQTVWSAVTAFAATAISVKVAVLVNILLIIIQALFIVLALISKNYVESVSSRQKDHHVEL